MQFSKEQIELIHARLRQNVGEDILMYVLLLEARAKKLEDVTKQGEELQNGASCQNKTGDTITLYLPDAKEEVEWPQVSWVGAHFQGLCLITNTDDEARALFRTLLTVKDVDAD